MTKLMVLIGLFWANTAFSDTLVMGHYTPKGFFTNPKVYVPQPPPSLTPRIRR